ncbi:hypothetical protein KSC_034820 [Ktedonobacter sp. SOSP1-52]|uniref:hypothetical protein n=1 Tax=Ktedonobacter sp. SOSP1-52 TaxID=2778366 RepID=UPI0019167F2C|nr:hypothetical protein [Ktedonobacter sp. SOSP1-52]GHO64590.1 hypothetical protein KSC_034820 [Ktedonobacter sp. SOSP1-52]
MCPRLFYPVWRSELCVFFCQRALRLWEGATARLLFTAHPRAFITSTVGTLIEPLLYPALLLILHQMLQAINELVGTAQMTGAVTASGIALIGLLLIQRLAIIIRDGSSNILRQQAWVLISTRIMHKLPSVPYSLFENNAFQARYGLVIREAAQRSITLVDSLLSTLPILQRTRQESPGH